MSDAPLGMVDVARDLARRGLRGDALLILNMLPGPGSVEVRDLRARLLAQLGRYAEAEDVWRNVEAECPEHQGAREGLLAVAGLRRNPIRRFRVALALHLDRVVGIGLALLLVLLVAGGAVLLHRRLAALAEGQRTLAEQAAEREEAVAEVLGQIRRDSTDLARLQLRTGEGIDEAKAALEGLAAALAANRTETAAALAEIKAETASAKAAAGAVGDRIKAETDKLAAAQQSAAKRLADQAAAVAKQQEATAAALAEVAAAATGGTGELGRSLAGLGAELAKLKTDLAGQNAVLEETRKRLLAETESLGKQLDTLVAADPSKRLADLGAQYLQLRASLNAQAKQSEELAGQLHSLNRQLAAPPPEPVVD